MKLNAQSSDIFDLKQNAKSQWAKEMFQNLKSKIPIMTSISKKDKSTHFNFIGLARHTSLAESLIYKSKRFRTTSEVYRAAMYIGMSILYHLTKDDGEFENQARARRVYKTIELLESVNYSRQIVDAVTLAARELIESADSGVIEFEDMTEKISTLVETLPKELRKLARDKIKRLLKGDSIINIAETKMQRGVKGVGKRRYRGQI